MDMAAYSGPVPGGPSETCGACGLKGAYLVAGREVVRCRHCSARQPFDSTGDALADLRRAAARLRVGSGHPSAPAGRPAAGEPPVPMLDKGEPAGSQLVCLVEDDEAVRKVVHRTLSRAGYRVSEFPDGRSAYRALLRQRPDLIILDVGLPSIDGLTLLSHLRPYVEAPILMLSGRVAERDRVSGLELGADDYLCKPFSPRELEARVKSLLRRVGPRSGGAG